MEPISQLSQLDDDPAQMEKAVQRCEPQFALPVQADALAGLSQFAAVIRAAVPEPAAERSGKGVLCRQQEELPARCQNSR